MVTNLNKTSQAFIFGLMNLSLQSMEQNIYLFNHYERVLFQTLCWRGQGQMAITPDSEIVEKLTLACRKEQY